MNIKVTIYDNRKYQLYDVTEAVSDIELTTEIFDQPGKCSFKLVRINDVKFWKGATVSIVLEGHPIFRGFIVGTKQSSEDGLLEISAFDQLWYLKNKDTYVFKGKTSADIFTKICQDFVLKYKVVDKSSYICAPRSNDGKGLYEIIKYALDDTLIHTKEWFIITDNFGVLEHRNIKSMTSDIIIGDYSGLTSFSYESSIDKETYNQIKLYRDIKPKDKKGKAIPNSKSKREIFIVNDTVNKGQTLKEWGILQLYEKVDEELTVKQIEQKALGMLKLYNSPTRTISLECIGIPTIKAGSIVPCKISDVDDIDINELLVVTKCTHKLDNKTHTMELQMEVARK